MVLALICWLKRTEHLNRVKPCISGESYKRTGTCLTLEESHAHLLDASLLQA